MRKLAHYHANTMDTIDCCQARIHRMNICINYSNSLDLFSQTSTFKTCCKRHPPPTQGLRHKECDHLSWIKDLVFYLVILKLTQTMAIQLRRKANTIVKSLANHSDQ